MASLEDYRKKRNFRQTREPSGEHKVAPGRRFVIQKHAASRLHYDFRLEQDGVLKSWAVPKGPSLDPGVKRLAVLVEDHPLDYGSFEGTIPQGEYGGGTVMLWDHGHWEPLDDPAKGWKKGRLHFRLHGTKLRGNWSLIRLKDEPNWLLFKETDEYADAEVDITEEDRSVTTRRSMEEIALHLEVEAPERDMPSDLKPQLATLVKEAPTGDNWVHEIKYDGYRFLTFVDRGEVRLITRGGLDWTSKFPSLSKALRDLPVQQAILDGEVVLLDERGVSSFQSLQNYLSNQRKGSPSVFFFDLLYLNGKDLRDLPLVERKAALKNLSLAEPLRYSEHIVGQGQEVFKQACALGCEGIISKESDTPYVSKRTQSWLKVKCEQTQTFTVIGYTEPNGGRNYFGSLVLAQNGKYAGKVGSGFDQKALESTYALFVEQDKPSVPVPRLARVHWLKPNLQARVSFSEKTDEGILRHPSFQGLEKSRPSVKFRLTHPERVIDASTGITKGQLAAYYEQVAERMLPYIEGRPLSGLRCPDGLSGESFWQKHRMKGMSADVHTVKVDGEDYVSVNSAAGLLALVQMSVVEFHPWGSRDENQLRPDRLVFDLDPDTGLEWPKVVLAAERVRDLLSEIGLVSFAKTTGGKGLHVVVPLEPEFEWPVIKEYTQRLMEELVRRHEGEYTTNLLKARRKGRIFLDYLRNGEGATSVAAYSVRARPGCPVSLPVSWEDVTPRLDPAKITIQDFRGFEERGYKAWSDFYSLRQRLQQ